VRTAGARLIRARYLKFVTETATGRHILDNLLTTSRSLHDIRPSIEVDGDGDLQLIEEPLLLTCRLGDAAEPDLAVVGGGQDVSALCRFPSWSR
jgi:hypothetical protein